ncbi:FecCD family ABC transporter permease [Kerstersia gyiorum]|uniref:FecCD family ABC transporter permease n=1 Tax=Kerstersia gyiorum TaxID=206506 RepID=UPI00196B7CAE|nr:iron chelate uptake ABC transporter family permease subunit [Kerstersia gyiorum]
MNASSPISRTARSVLSTPVWRTRHASFVMQPRLAVVTCLLLLLILACAAFAMSSGRVALSLGQVADILLGRGDGGMGERIVLNIRLPRVLTAIFAGAALGISGAVFQSVSRNALGSPDVIGFTTGAATGALMQIIVFDQGSLAVALSAVLGGLFTAAAVYLLALRGGAVGGYRLVLVGIGVGAILNALNGLMLVKGKLDNAVMANLWLAGSLDARTWQHVLPVMIGTLVLIPLILLSARTLHLTEMGDDLASQLGIRVERTRVLMITYAVILAALATGAAGPIAFVALAAPQLALRLTRARHLPVISAAAMGALLLVVADLLIQHIPLAMAIPIGRMTGIVGGVYLLWLLTRSRQV